ncbi:thymidine phosphorylase [bacterium]|nr:thymidine phosphorylase [bacterium]
MHSPYEFIAHKQSGKEHPPKEIQTFIERFINHRIPDYQMTAWLMAVYFQGMTFSETEALTSAFINSGRQLTHNGLKLPIGDKHSTGGVGDKITLILAPILAACGIAVPTITGRGLGFTGGTLDKLESLPGMRVNLSLEEIEATTAEFGLAFGAQTNEIVPADQRIYALRDVTATVRSLPLITSSILSKKVAEGIQAIVFDVKCGHGAFMSSYNEAHELAKWLVHVGQLFGLNTSALITKMDTPLGRTVGNWLELEESVQILAGNQDLRDILDLTFALGATLMKQLQFVESRAEAYTRMKDVIRNGLALEKLEAVMMHQSGDLNSFKLLTRGKGDEVHRARASRTVEATISGYLNNFWARDFGFAAILLGAGRQRSDDIINPAAGIRFHCDVEDQINAGDPLFTLYADTNSQLDDAEERLKKSVEIVEEKPERVNLIIDEVS